MAAFYRDAITTSTATTFVAKSRLHGRGLYLRTQSLLKGQTFSLVVDHLPLPDSGPERKRLLQDRENVICETHDKCICDLSVGAGRWINHSYTFNGELVFVDGQLSFRALKYIRVGCELTVDYGPQYTGHF